MENTINERIKYVMEIFGYRSVRAFATRIGIAPTSLNDVIRNGAEPKFSTLSKILEAETSLSAEWLLRGKGPVQMIPIEHSHYEILQRLANRVDRLTQDVMESQEELIQMRDRVLGTLRENEQLRILLAQRDNSVKGA